MKYKLVSLFLCLLDIAIVWVSFFLVAWLRSGTRSTIYRYGNALLGFMAIWVVLSLIGCKYNYKSFKKYSDVLSCLVRNNVVILAIIFFLIYFLQLFFFSRTIVLSTILLTTIIELILFSLAFFSIKLQRDTDISKGSLLVTKSARLDKDVEKFYNGDFNNPAIKLPYEPEFQEESLADTVMVKLWQKYLSDDMPLFDYLNEMLELTRFADRESLILNSSTFYNIEHLYENSQQLFINLHRINDIRRINRYFIRVNENLRPGGVYVCCGETINQRYSRFCRDYGKIAGNILYFCDFIFRRICPKIPITQGLYFALTKGRNRSLSETEILGRLYFCGFIVLGYKEINGMMYFIARKIKEPSRDLDPSYGLLIKLKRVGLNGVPFNCYKLRTMHPYSEYLQKYVLERYSVAYSGKFANDFRITSWGRFMRRFWIDELPQFINLFKGDVRIIGARAISPHFLEQYPDDVKALRLRTKPGLIPVYTADRATTLGELINSERRYLEQREKRPIRTDTLYLCRALFNIFTRRVKSLDCYN